MPEVTREFAKLFDRPAYGQVLLKLDVDDEGRPELRWFAHPPGVGVCSLAFGFEDDDAGWGDARRAFDQATEKSADEMGRTLRSAVEELLDD